MRTLLCSLLLVGLALPSGGCVKRIHTQLVEGPTHEAHIQPIWTANCLFCHSGDDPDIGMDLTDAYDQLVDVKSKESDLMRIAPGNVEGSYLWHKLNSSHEAAGGRGSKMPKMGTIHETDLAVLRAWIEAGAPK